MTETVETVIALAWIVHVDNFTVISTMRAGDVEYSTLSMKK